MTKSLKFRNIEKNLYNIFSIINDSNDIAKYIYYLVDDPLSESSVPINLIEEGYYHLNFFDDTIPPEEKIRLFLNPVYGNLDRPDLSDIKFLLEIVMPIKYNILSGMGQLRSIRILDEITQLVDGQRVAGVPETKVTHFNSGRIKDTDYMVSAIEISVKSPTYKG